MFGHPLVTGEELVATTLDDLIVRWKPKSEPTAIAVAHPMEATPYPDLTPLPNLGGYPIVQSSTGFVVADDLVNPFISGLQANLLATWHRDILQRLGVASVQGDTLFSNVGGESALATLCAISPSSGLTKWTYSPSGFPTESTYSLMTTTQRRFSVGEAAVLSGDVNPHTKAHGAPLRKGDTGTKSVPFTQETLAIQGEHGYWSNPGVVVTKGNVFGQVGGKIVSLAQANGQLKWEFALANGEIAHSIAATSTHLFVSLRTRLIALDLSTGKLAWKEATERGGTLTIGNGMVFLAMGTLDPSEQDGGQLIAFATDPDASAESSGGSPPTR